MAELLGKGAALTRHEFKHTDGLILQSSPRDGLSPGAPLIPSLDCHLPANPGTASSPRCQAAGSLSLFLNPRGTQP